MLRVNFTHGFANKVIVFEVLAFCISIFVFLLTEGGGVLLSAFLSSGQNVGQKGLRQTQGELGGGGGWGARQASWST